MTMIVWRSLDENPWLAVPKQVVTRFLPPPGEDARTCGPGPFSMADPDVVRTQLRIAGYDGVGFEQIDAPLLVGRTPEEAVELQFALGPAGEIFREAGEQAERQREPMTAALTEALGATSRPRGC